MRDIFDMTDKVAVITGGGGNLGGVFADALAKQGADIVLTDVSEERCDAAAEMIRGEYGVRAVSVQADISNEADVKRIFATAVESLGRVDVLVNNAATQPEGFFTEFEEYPLDVWNRVLSVNLTGMFLCAREAGPLLVEQKSGSVINISSIYGVAAPDQRIYEGTAFNTPAVYSVAKAGVIGLTRHLCTLWAPHNIRSNAIIPGGIFNDHTEPFLSKYASRVPMGRMGDRNDLAGAVVFLASDASAYLTGQNLIVDGGLTAW